MDTSQLCNINNPVLLQEGFDITQIIVPGTLAGFSEFRLTTDRGDLKYIDFYTLDYSAQAIASTCFATISLGGQNLIQDENVSQWGNNFQFGRDHKWQIRSKFSDGQIGNVFLNGQKEGLNATASQQIQVVAKYTSRQHEQFLNNFRLKFGQGLKRRQYVHSVENVAIANNISQSSFVSPRNQGQIIGVAVSVVVPLLDAVNYPNNEQNFTFVDILADGVEIIKNVSTSYYNMANGRDYYLQPMCLNPGATFTIRTTSVLPNTFRFQVYLDLYFDN